MSPILLLLVILLIAFLPVVSWFYKDRIKTLFCKMKAALLCKESTVEEDSCPNPLGPRHQQIYYIGGEEVKFEPLPNVVPEVSKPKEPGDKF